MMYMPGQTSVLRNHLSKNWRRAVNSPSQLTKDMKILKPVLACLVSIAFLSYSHEKWRLANHTNLSEEFLLTFFGKEKIAWYEAVFLWDLLIVWCLFCEETLSYSGSHLVKKTVLIIKVRTCQYCFVGGATIQSHTHHGTIGPGKA